MQINAASVIQHNVVPVKFYYKVTGKHKRLAHKITEKVLLLFLN